MEKIKFIYEYNNLEMKHENTETIERVLKKYSKLMSLKERDIDIIVNIVQRQNLIPLINVQPINIIIIMQNFFRR